MPAARNRIPKWLAGKKGVRRAQPGLLTFIVSKRSTEAPLKFSRLARARTFLTFSFLPIAAHPGSVAASQHGKPRAIESESAEKKGGRKKSFSHREPPGTGEPARSTIFAHAYSALLIDWWLVKGFRAFCSVFSHAEYSAGYSKLHMRDAHTYTPFIGGTLSFLFFLFLSLSLFFFFSLLFGDFEKPAARIECSTAGLRAKRIFRVHWPGLRGASIGPRTDSCRTPFPAMRPFAVVQ